MSETRIIRAMCRLGRFWLVGGRAVGSLALLLVLGAILLFPQSEATRIQVEASGGQVLVDSPFDPISSPERHAVSEAGGAEGVRPSRIEDIAFWSEAVGKEMSAKVYLPAGYDSRAGRRFPVLYLLHGLNSDQNQWTHCGLFKKADEMIAAGEIQPMIIVAPKGDNGYWVDHASNGPRYGTYVSREVVSLIDQRYRTISLPESRAVGGISMGGHGALQLAMNAPETFSVVGAHSVALRTHAQAFDFFGDETYFRKHDPVQLFRDRRSQAGRLDIWIDIGSTDQWYPPADAFHRELSLEGIQHDWRVWPGGHDAEYWSAHTGDYLAFYSRELIGDEGGSRETRVLRITDRPIE